MSQGRYGEFGGQYIPETLMNEIHHVEEAYEFIYAICSGRDLKKHMNFIKMIPHLMKN